MIYEVKYNSLNSYEEPVSEAFFEYLLLPCNDNTQSLLDFRIRHSSGEDPFFCTNSFGFKTIRIRCRNNFNEFGLSFSSKVDKPNDDALPQNNLSLQEQLAILSSHEFYINHHPYLSNTIFTRINDERYGSLFPFTRKNHILDYLINLNQFIYFLLSYTPNHTTVQTTAEDVLKINKGVCQDFTHLFLGIARKSGIPARYVSGYLDQGINFVGAAMMHAWAEAFVPGIGWTGFDPTNNLQVNSHYIKVCHGIDYNDCTPIKGILRTKGSNSTVHSVEVNQ